VNSDFELRLLHAIQPIRHLFLAQALYHLFTTDLYDALWDERFISADSLAGQHGMDRERLDGYLVYLANEGIVTRSASGGYRLAQAGIELAEFRPWYELLVGGYSATLRDLPDVLRDRQRYAGRDDAMVGRGSCGISRYDALPLLRSLLRPVLSASSTVVDIGCGDGRLLLDIVAALPGCSGVGVDPEARSVLHAKELAEQRGLGDRVTFVTQTAEEYLGSRDRSPGGTCYLVAFVLQELLEQRGRGAVVALVRDLLATVGSGGVAVVEVDRRDSDPTVMRHGLGLAYYNPYFLLHRVTRQRLEGVEFWRRLIDDAGGRVARWEQVDPTVDSTGLEFGCLITPA
jgi:2-ketoarginine methyltransferase